MANGLGSRCFISLINLQSRIAFNPTPACDAAFEASPSQTNEVGISNNRKRKEERGRRRNTQAFDVKRNFQQGRNQGAAEGLVEVQKKAREYKEWVKDRTGEIMKDMKSKG